MQGKNWELALQLRPWESCAYSRVLPLFKVYKLRVSTIYFPRWLLTFRMTWQPVSNHAMKLKPTTLVPLPLISKNVQIDPQSCLSKRENEIRVQRERVISARMQRPSKELSLQFLAGPDCFTLNHMNLWNHWFTQSCISIWDPLPFYLRPRRGWIAYKAHWQDCFNCMSLTEPH
jgi:hypothetical protein